MKNTTSSRAGFTLIELLIVIGLLGALATLIIPHFRVEKEESTKAIVQSEMYDIQRAFMRFYNDCQYCTGRVAMANWTNVNLAPLLVRVDPTNSLFAYEKFDLNKNRGWRGPYAVPEGSFTNSGGAVYPALLDPFGNPYEVLRPDGTNLYLRPQAGDMLDTNECEELERQLTFEVE